MPSAAKSSLRPPDMIEPEIDFYRLFAFVFGAPTRDRFEAISDPSFWDALRPLWMETDYAGGFPGTSTFKNFADYEAAYIALFDVGVPQPPVPLLESAHQKALPAQQTALENTHFYEVLGLTADTSQYAPDHLVTQLEFLAAVRYTQENSADDDSGCALARLERDFLERHLLNWLPAAERKLTQLRPPVFPRLFTLLLAFLRRRHAALAV